MTIESFSGTHPWHSSVLAETDAYEAGTADKIIWNIEHGFCPRCERPLPTPPEWPAGSRITRCRSIPICTSCGEDEGHQALEGSRDVDELRRFSDYSSAGSWPVPLEEIEERDTRSQRRRIGRGMLTISDGQFTLDTEDGPAIPIDSLDTGGWASGATCDCEK